MEVNNTVVDLRPQGYWIEFSEGFQFSKNWSIAASFIGASINQSLLTWNDDLYRANVFYREGEFKSQDNINKGYFELQIEFPCGISIVTSKYIDPINIKTKYTLWITKENNIYSLIYHEEV